MDSHNSYKGMALLELPQQNSSGRSPTNLAAARLPASMVDPKRVEGPSAPAYGEETTEAK